jgi:hypothetical protein
VNPDSAVLDKPVMTLADLTQTIEFKVPPQAMVSMQVAFSQVAMQMQAISTALAAMPGCGCPVCFPGGRENFTPAHQLPPREFWSPQLVQDLRGGARAIRRLGWVQGSWVAPGVGVCGAGGLMVAITGRDTPNQGWFEADSDWSHRLNVAVRAMGTWLGGSLPAYNDHVATGPEQVIAELESCADAVEKELALRSGRPIEARRFTGYPEPGYTPAMPPAESVEPITHGAMKKVLAATKVLEPA